MGTASYEEFAQGKRRPWKFIDSGIERTAEVKNTIQKSFTDNHDRISPFSSDVDMVVFGSLARKEYTLESDLDWTLLVDGPFNAEHLTTGNMIRNKLKEAEIKDPGSSGMFGQLTFSHELIHNIGGNDDTNHNLSRRILLLLESQRINLGPGDLSSTAHKRVIRGIIREYITHDSGIESKRKDDHERVPRFLLNDIVRFWRTMCVDFAYKQKEQDGMKWGLRNIKLRTSRRLLFAKGLLMCFYCYGNQKDWPADKICEELEKLVYKTPIEVFVSLKDHFQIKEEDLTRVLDYYDQFLSILNSKELREHLSSVDRNSAYVDKRFLEAREICDNFRKSLHDIFIINSEPLKELTLRYAIF